MTWPSKKLDYQRLGPFTIMKKINDLIQVFIFHGNPSYVSCFMVKALPCIHHFKKIFWVVFIDWNQLWIRVQGGNFFWFEDIEQSIIIF
jgi:hypothetical protein